MDNHIFELFSHFRQLGDIEICYIHGLLLRHRLPKPLGGLNSKDIRVWLVTGVHG